MTVPLSALQTLRIPRGLWANLEETVIQQDRQFLTEVARSLGLPVQDVLRRCLGTGAPTPVPVLWGPSASADPEICPWWECHGDGLWRRCPRMRLSPTLPCTIHERCTPCPLARLHSDPVIRALKPAVPVRLNGELYWVTESGAAFSEDGMAIEGCFRRITHRDQQLWVYSKEEDE